MCGDDVQPNTVGTVAATEQNCNYIITFPTAYACLNAPPPPPNNSTDGSGLSGGWIFVIMYVLPHIL